ncbi:hypothetical protein [Sphingosinithalassobacter portus]|uniref:hypothetical protein n=1 Tax=Stakelama portus TaxID=2676234 RepID=UPI000D6EAFF1|nr:hypothetical protein [Sphingosinithalassobacter portus]
MDDARRRELEARRAAMQRRNDREQQRRALWGVDEKLTAQGAVFELLYRDTVPRFDWIGGLVPAGAFHLRWDDVPAAASEYVAYDERAAFAGAILETLAEDARIHVVPGNGLAPIIALTRAEFARHAEMLTDIDSEMWLSGAPEWLIEFRKNEAHVIGLKLPESIDWHRKPDGER